MRHTIRCIAFAVAALLGSAGVAAATDWCLSLGGTVFFVQNFAKPIKGACKPIVGNRLTFPLAGVACHNTADDGVRPGFTWYGDGAIEMFHLDIAIASLTGTSWSQFEIHSDATTGAGTTTAVTSFAPCGTATVD